MPWHFTIEFDEDKAKENGYDPDELYDCVGRIVETMGNVRTGRGSWQAESRENQFGAQCPAVALPVKQPWVMENVKSFTTYEDMNEPDGEDYLEMARRVRPELVRRDMRPPVFSVGDAVEFDTARSGTLRGTVADVGCGRDRPCDIMVEAHPETGRPCIWKNVPEGAVRPVGPGG